MGIKVCKFGGTSLADASQIMKVKSIIDADSDRKVVVPSAPGKRHSEDQKVRPAGMALNLRMSGGSYGLV